MEDDPIIDAPVDQPADHPVFIVSQLVVMGDPDNAGAGIPATPGECPTCGPTAYNPKSMRL